MSLCPEHEDVIRRLERAVVVIEKLDENMRGLASDTRELRTDIKTLLRVNGARREVIGELRGRLLTLAAIIGAAVAAITTVLVRIFSG